MKSKKAWSLLLLISSIFSFMHDYTFSVLEDDHHSVEEYITILATDNHDSGEDLHDIHSKYHISEICLIEPIAFEDIEKTSSTFIQNAIFLSWSSFSFLKPPIL